MEYASIIVQQVIIYHLGYGMTVENAVAVVVRDHELSEADQAGLLAATRKELAWRNRLC